MKVKNSKYIESLKPELKELLAAILKKYPYASILATDSFSKAYGVNKKSTSVREDGLLCNRGFVLRVFDGKYMAEYSTNHFDRQEIPGVVEVIDEEFKAKEGNDQSATGYMEYKIPDDEEMKFSESTEYEVHPMDMGDEKLLEQLTKLKDLGLACSPDILNCDARFNYQQYSKLFLSPNREMEQNVMWSNGALMFTAKKGDVVRSCYKGFSISGGAELLSGMEAAIEKTGKTTLELLDSEPMVPGEYDCICDPEVTGMIVHEAFGHGVEMDMFVKDRAQAREYIGKPVASPMVTMHDGAKGILETATFFFDDEGTLAHDTVIIKDGILQTGICDALSAAQLGIEPTGNGRRQSFERKAYTRMTNTYFKKGQDKLEDMIASISYGFMLENATSGMEDPKNWGIQCMVDIAREIKDGKFTGKIFSPCVLSGYVPDLLKSISMVSDDEILCGTGFCGKGYKEFVKVSDGGPYIKARIRLG